MDTTKKMFLVPNSLWSNIALQQRYGAGGAPATKFLSDLDGEMSKIINDKSLPVDVKASKYQDALSKFSTARDNILSAPVNMSIEENASRHKEGDDTEKSGVLAGALPAYAQIAVAQGIPKDRVSAYMVLLQHMQNNPNFQWSRNGALVIDGKPIQGSNITDLLHYFTKKGKVTDNPVPGYKQFALALNDTNAPRVAIGNSARYADAIHNEAVGYESFVTPQSGASTSKSTPSSSAARDSRSDTRSPSHSDGRKRYSGADRRRRAAVASSTVTPGVVRTNANKKQVGQGKLNNWVEY